MTVDDRNDQRLSTSSDKPISYGTLPMLLKRNPSLIAIMGPFVNERTQSRKTPVIVMGQVGVYQQDTAKTVDRRGFLPMQAKQHGDLSTIPAENSNSGRVQTMIEGNDPQEQMNNKLEEVEELNQNEMEALLVTLTTLTNVKRGDVVEGVIVRIDQ